MLRIGLTGGIGAGKSAVSRRLVERGLALVDADRMAREVVEAGTEGLAAVVAAFGPEVLRADGTLDRPALGQRVFGDAEQLAVLNGLLHPRIGARTAELEQQAARAGAPALVHDVPLLVENGLAPLYHLVVVVEADEDARLQRLARTRGMSEQEARSRMAVQATDDARREAADVVLDNRGGLPDLHAAVDVLVRDRLLPYAENLAAGRRAARAGVALVDADPSRAAAGRRLVRRLEAVTGRPVEHVGSTAVPGLVAKDVIDLQVLCPDAAAVDALRPVLADAGFPVVPGIDGDPVRPTLDPDPAQWRKAFHASADPGRAADVHVRVAGSAGARAATALRDLLREDPAAREDYARAKRRLAAEHPDDVEAYAEGKTPVLLPLLERALGSFLSEGGRTVEG